MPSGGQAAIVTATRPSERDGTRGGRIMSSIGTRTSKVETVTSKDGTPIAYWRSGEGPPLVVIHGTSAAHDRWAPVLPAFEQHFTVCAVDRRGRGSRGASENCAIEREFEDVAAVVDSLGEPAF